MHTLKTERLLLRQWLPEDAAPFAELNADPQVMEHFPARLSAAESDTAMARYRQSIVEQGWGFWAAQELTTGQFIGFVGLNRPRFEAAFTPCVEIGWRLQRSAWGQGYASEAARACLQFGFGTLKLTEIVSITFRGNLRSQRVMQRIGMSRDLAGDFLHPLLAPEHPITPHVLYRLTLADWQKQNGERQ